MESKNLRPSPLHNKNLVVIYASRISYFCNKGLYPYLLSTFFFYIDEEVRLPLAKNLLPLINDENDRNILEMAIKEQGKWEPLKPFKSSWTLFRKAGIGSIKGQPFEDFLQLDYYRFFNGVIIPDNADLGLFWGGLVDFLRNSWSILEEFCLVIDTKNRIQEQEKAGQAMPQKEDVKIAKAVPIISWADMQLEHHFINILLRLRAGWDKLADYVVAKYFNITISDSWEKRISKLDRDLQPKLNNKQKMYWNNWLKNAKDISGRLKEIRDFELHKISLRTRETLGNPNTSYSMNDLENFVLFEHFRLQESYLLILAMIRST